VELLLIVANVATAVVLFPIVKRQNEMLALGYVTARLLESTFIAIGLVTVLGVVSLQQQDPTGAGPARSVWRSPRSRIGRSCSDPASSSAWETGYCLAT
jgi:Domain of unknown function (DUF4386)